MYTVSIETQLHGLRPGDCVKYSCIDWYIKDYSTYQDTQGYQTEEWLLVSAGNSEYYLLREYDAREEINSVLWYVSNQLHDVRLYNPEFPENPIPLTTLWKEMQAFNTPYPELKLFDESYYFESQTEASYDSEGKTKFRITWDYWDKDHFVNLAIEAFANLQLDIYSTRIVKPEEFCNIQKGVDSKLQLLKSKPELIIELMIAIILLCVGIFLIIFG